MEVPFGLWVSTLFLMWISGAISVTVIVDWIEHEIRTSTYIGAGISIFSICLAIIATLIIA